MEPDKTIVVLPHGWVLIGELNGCVLSNASVIRRWGTTKGLGELAAAGPTKDTILDFLADKVTIGDPLFTFLAEGWK